MSKRTLVIIIVIQLVLVVMFAVYAMVQRNQAIKYEQLAVEAAKEARAAQMRAEQNEKMAIVAEREAIAQLQLTQQALQDCKGKK